MSRINACILNFIKQQTISWLSYSCEARALSLSLLAWNGIHSIVIWPRYGTMTFLFEWYFWAMFHSPRCDYVYISWTANRLSVVSWEAKKKNQQKRIVTKRNLCVGPTKTTKLEILTWYELKAMNDLKRFVYRNIQIHISFGSRCVSQSVYFVCVRFTTKKKLTKVTQRWMAPHGMAALYYTHNSTDLFCFFASISVIQFSSVLLHKWKKSINKHKKERY